MTFRLYQKEVAIEQLIPWLSYLEKLAHYEELQMVLDEHGDFAGGEGPILAEGPIEIDLEGPITLDLGAVRDELVEKGWHAVRIERADAGLSSQKEIPQVFLLTRCTDEADPDYNQTIVWNCMLSGDGLKFTKRCLKAAGMPDKLNYPTAQALADDLVGREFDAKVGHRKNKETGEMQVNVSNWRPIVADLGLTLE